MAEESTQPSDQQNGAGQPQQGQGPQQSGGGQPQQPAPGQAEVQRRKQQAAQQAAQDEDRGSSRFFTKDHLIEEGAITARNLYGKSKVGDEDEWYDLVDVFLMLPTMLEQEFAKKFRKRAGLRNWESSMNRHLIPMKYLIAKKAIENALDEDMIEPLFRDRIKYYFLVKLPPIGRPLAYIDKIGPSKEGAKNWAMYETGELSREEVLGISSASSEIEIIKRRGQLKKKKFHKARKKLQEAQEKRQKLLDNNKKGTQEYHEVMGKVQHYSDLTEEYRREFNDLKDEYEALKSSYDEVED
jgi:hypothetical protein